MKSYGFNDLVTFSGATANEVKNWVQKGTIRPDIKDTTGTGTHRSFSFFDVFEACVARKLNQIPGGMPIHAVSAALNAIRIESEISTFTSSPWGSFVNPATRDPAARFWLCRFPDGVVRVLDGLQSEVLLRESTEVLVMVRLDTLLISLERRTDDHGDTADHHFTKRDPSLVEPTESPIEPRAVDAPSAPAAIAAKAKD